MRHETRGRGALIDLWLQRGQRSVGHRIDSSAIRGEHGYVEGQFTSEAGTGSFISAVTLDSRGLIAEYVSYSSLPAAGGG